MEVIYGEQDMHPTFSIGVQSFTLNTQCDDKPHVEFYHRCLQTAFNNIIINAQREQIEEAHWEGQLDGNPDRSPSASTATQYYFDKVHSIIRPDDWIDIKNDIEPEDGQHCWVYFPEDQVKKTYHGIYFPKNSKMSRAFFSLLDGGIGFVEHASHWKPFVVPVPPHVDTQSDSRNL